MRGMLQDCVVALRAGRQHGEGFNTTFHTAQQQLADVQRQAHQLAERLRQAEQQLAETQRQAHQLTRDLEACRHQAARQVLFNSSVILVQQKPGAVCGTQTCLALSALLHLSSLITQVGAAVSCIDEAEMLCPGGCLHLPPR